MTDTTKFSLADRIIDLEIGSWMFEHQGKGNFVSTDSNDISFRRGKVKNIYNNIKELHEKGEYKEGKIKVIPVKILSDKDSQNYMTLIKFEYKEQLPGNKGVNFIEKIIGYERKTDGKIVEGIPNMEGRSEGTKVIIEYICPIDGMSLGKIQQTDVNPKLQQN